MDDLPAVGDGLLPAGGRCAACLSGRVVPAAPASPARRYERLRGNEPLRAVWLVQDRPAARVEVEYRAADPALAHRRPDKLQRVRDRTGRATDLGAGIGQSVLDEQGRNPC